MKLTFGNSITAWHGWVGPKNFQHKAKKRPKMSLAEFFWGGVHLKIENCCRIPTQLDLGLFARFFLVPVGWTLAAGESPWSTPLLGSSSAC